MMHEHVFKFRWLYWAFGLGMLALNRLPGLTGFRNRCARSIEASFRRWLVGTCALFFLAALASKLSQLWTFRLNGMDFWLFEDMTAQLLRGEAMLTRFAPQGIGFVQHGAVHGMLSWFLTVPLSVLGGSLGAALVYGPLVLSLGGFFLGLTALEITGSAVFAWLLSAAFLISTQVGHVLLYDVHPESAYPLAVFFWAWAFQKDRVGLLVVATLFGMGIKEDSFLVFFPLIILAALRGSGLKRRNAWLSFGVAGLAFAFQMKAISAWASGAWGPKFWDGLPVKIPQGADLLKGIRWSSPGEAFEAVRWVLAQSGGAGGALLKCARFLISRPWLSLVIFAPWILLKWEFWWVLGPLAMAYAQLGRAAILNLYYSAPFLGLFWLMAARFSSGGNGERKGSWRWILLAVIFLGDGSPEIYFPSHQVFELKKATEAVLRCLPEKAERGVVTAPLLAWVPKKRILTQRFPEPGSADWKNVEFVMLAPEVPSYEIPRERIEAWRTEASARGFVEACIGAGAGPQAEVEPGAVAGGVRIWVRPEIVPMHH